MSLLNMNTGFERCSNSHLFGEGLSDCTRQRVAPFALGPLWVIHHCRLWVVITKTNLLPDCLTLTIGRGIEQVARVEETFKKPLIW